MDSYREINLGTAGIKIRDMNGKDEGIGKAISFRIILLRREMRDHHRK